MSKVKDGIIGTCAYALQECARPEVKQVKSQLQANVLRIGDTTSYPQQSREIFIKASKCTAAAHPPSLKKFYKRDRSDKMDEDVDMSDVYVQLKHQTDYMFKPGQKPEESEEVEENKADSSGQKEKNTEKAERQDLIKGFKYGTSFAPCPDGEFPRLESPKGMDICGFIEERDVSQLPRLQTQHQVTVFRFAGTGLWEKYTMCGVILPILPLKSRYLLLSRPWMHKALQLSRGWFPLSAQTLKCVYFSLESWRGLTVSSWPRYYL